MKDEEPSLYIVFVSIVISALATALEQGQLEVILPLCAFLEEVSFAAREDNGLHGLVRVEVAEWLGWMEHEDRLAPWVGPETKRICNFVPGLATQRWQL